MSYNSYISGIPVKRWNMDCKEPAKPGIYYHYTSLGTLWAILDSEALRATQARFSNDSEEIKKGVHILKELCSLRKDGPLGKYANKLESGSGEDIDCYIACFCGDNDVLSQWRGYCRNDGVSVGFAFDETRRHYFFKDAPDNEREPQEIRLFPVWYVAEDSKTYKGKKTVTEKKLKKELTKKLKTLDELSDEQICKVFIDATIPLIKHAGFCEEDEYRLIILNTQSEHGGKIPFPLDQYVKYSPADGEGLKRPYITISFEKKPMDQDVNEVRLYGLTERSEVELHRLFPPHSIKYQIIHENTWNETQNLQIIIGQGKDQKNVFEAFDRILTADASRPQNERLFQDVTLWCEGHLPIRSIMVSPCQNQKEIIESIRHYCLHEKYWMKYVEISGSSTPYRRPK